MKRIRSFANMPRLERQENPKSAKVKKKRPSRFWNPEMSFLHLTSISRITVKTRRDHSRYVMEETAT